MGAVCPCMRGEFKFKGSAADEAAFEALDRPVGLDDFNPYGDDREPLTAKEFAALNRFEKMEFTFPFYLMDVNGYVFKIKLAMLAENPEMKHRIYMVSKVSLVALEKSFSTHSSWDAFKVHDSPFVNFLKDTCLDHIEEENGTVWFSTFKLRCLGILMCEGDAEEKAEELYQNINDTGVMTLTCNDKDL